MLKVERWNVFRSIEIDRLLFHNYVAPPRCVDLMKSGDQIQGRVAGVFWDLSDPESYYDPALIEMLTCVDVEHGFQVFDQYKCPYIMPPFEGSEERHNPIITSHQELIAAHGDMYPMLTFWMSRLMLDGLIEKVDDYYVLFT